MNKTKYIHFRIKKSLLSHNNNIIVHSYNCLTNNDLRNACNCKILN